MAAAPQIRFMCFRQNDEPVIGADFHANAFPGDVTPLSVQFRTLLTTVSLPYPEVYIMCKSVDLIIISAPT